MKRCSMSFRDHWLYAALAFCALSMGSVRGDILTVQVYQGHTYFLLTGNTWTGSQDEAVSLGGNLVTVNDQEEQNFLYSTFAFDPAKYLWIGLNDAASNGDYTWISGEPVTYTNWAGGEPTLSRVEMLSRREGSELTSATALFWGELSISFHCSGRGSTGAEI